MCGESLFLENRINGVPVTNETGKLEGKQRGQVTVKYAPHLTGFTRLNAVFDSPPL
jgi:hypothetical protein